jgi:hypothetical protein
MSLTGYATDTTRARGVSAPASQTERTVTAQPTTNSAEPTIMPSNSAVSREPHRCTSPNGHRPRGPTAFYLWAMMIG